MPIPSVQSPALVLTAIRKIYPELKQRLPAAEWRAIRGQLDPAISQLSDPARSSEHPGAVLNVVSILTQNETSRETFAARLRAQDAILSLAPHAGDVTSLQAILPAADAEAETPNDSSERRVTLKPGGLGGAKSLKLRNFHLDFAELLKIAASSATSLHSVLTAPNPLVIAGSVLTIAQSLVASASATVGEEEASLFWAFIQAAGKRKVKTATEAALRTASDKERTRFGLSPFKPAEFTRALKKLESLHAIVPAGKSRWQLTESYRVSK